MRKIQPRCMSPYENSDKPEKAAGYSSLGYLMPCCWTDPRNMMDLENRLPRNKQLKDNKLYKNLFKEELKLSNVNSVEEIILSDEWREFFKALKYAPEKAPELCHRYCGTDPKLWPGKEQINIKKRIEYE